MAQSAISNIIVVPVPRTPTVTGRALVAIGTRGPLFDQRPVNCTDCRDFQTVMVRDGRSLVSVDCHCVTSSTTLAG